MASKKPRPKDAKKKANANRVGASNDGWAALENGWTALFQYLPIYFFHDLPTVLFRPIRVCSQLESSDSERRVRTTLFVAMSVLIVTVRWGALGDLDFNVHVFRRVLEFVLQILLVAGGTWLIWRAVGSRTRFETFFTVAAYFVGAAMVPIAVVSPLMAAVAADRLSNPDLLVLRWFVTFLVEIFFLFVWYPISSRTYGRIANVGRFRSLLARVLSLVVFAASVGLIRRVPGVFGA